MLKNYPKRKDGIMINIIKQEIAMKESLKQRKKDYYEMEF